MGEKGKSLEFFKKYMGNRWQKTSVNGYTSEEAEVTCGAAKGSILGPLILINYIYFIYK